MKILLLLCSFLVITAARAQELAIEQIRRDILYRGVPNPLLIVASKYPCKSIVASTNNGKIEKREKCHYNITPSHNGWATVYVRSVNGKDTIGYRIYRVVDLPLPELVVAIRTEPAEMGGSAVDRIKSSDIQQLIAIAAEYKNINIDGLRPSVTKFTLTVTGKTGSQSVTESSAFFSKQVKDLAKTAHPGDIITISDIHVDGPVDHDMKMPPIKLIVE